MFTWKADGLPEKEAEWREGWVGEMRKRGLKGPGLGKED